MLNLKKGLALVLAAATAISFAPVSTLGLTALAADETAASGTEAAAKTYTSYVKVGSFTSGQFIYLKDTNASDGVKYYVSSEESLTDKTASSKAVQIPANQWIKVTESGDKYSAVTADGKNVTITGDAVQTKENDGVTPTAVKASTSFVKSLFGDTEAQAADEAKELNVFAAGKGSNIKGYASLTAKNSVSENQAAPTDGEITNPIDLSDISKANDAQKAADDESATTGWTVSDAAKTIRTYGSDTQNFTITYGEETTYTLKLDGFHDNDTFSLTSDDTSNLDILYDKADKTAKLTSAGTRIKNGDSFKIKLSSTAAAKSGIKVVLSWGDQATQRYVITVNIANPSGEPYFMINEWYADHDSAAPSDTQYTDLRRQLNSTSYEAYVTTAPDQAVQGQNGTAAHKQNYLQVAGGDSTSWRFQNVTSNNSDIVKVANVTTQGQKQDTWQLYFLKEGTATLNATVQTDTAAYYDNANVKANATRNITITINVVAKDSTFTAGPQNNAITKTNYNSVAPSVVGVVYLTAKDSSKSLNINLKNAAPGEEVHLYVSKNKDTAAHTPATYSASAADNSTSASRYNNTDLVVSTAGNGTVTATANALNATENYYDVLVTDHELGAANAKAAVIRVITIREAKPFTTLTVKTKDAADKDITDTAAAEYDADGSIKDVTKAGHALTLSTADRKTLSFVPEKNTTKDLDIKSSNNSVVTYDKATNTLQAKGLGTAVITVKALSDTTYYGNVTLTFAVTVTDQQIVNQMVIDNTEKTIYLTKDSKTATVKAHCPGGQTPAFRLVSQNADGSFSVNNSNQYVSVDAKTGVVTYTGIGQGHIFVEAYSDVATDSAKAPRPAQIRVEYSDTQIVSDFAVTSAKAVNLTVGGTSRIETANATSGTSIAYTTSDSSIATVSDGVITAVAPGIAVITVTDPGNSSRFAKSVDITVNVKAAVKKPAKVTGVKVANQKGGKVKVTWKALSNPNVKYYVKKTINGKSAGKSVGSNSTTLTVKKGATVKVKVKAYVFNESQKKLVGSYSKTVSKKTDKK